MSVFDEIDWAAEAAECGWPEDRIERLAETATALRSVVVFIHRDVILLEREPDDSAYPTRRERFSEVREHGTLAGVARANRALSEAGLEVFE